MPVTPTTFPNHYTLIAKFKSSGGDHMWSNSVDIFDSAGVPAPTDAIITAFRNWWRDNLVSTCTLLEMELRNWTYGVQPFSTRAALWISSPNLLGNKIAAYGGEGAALSPADVAFIKITNAGPKAGHMFLRQLIDHDDVAVTGYGEPYVVAPGARVTDANLQLVNFAHINSFLGAADPGMRVVHFSRKLWNLNPVPANNPFSSNVSAINYIGPRNAKVSHKSRR